MSPEIDLSALAAKVAAYADGITAYDTAGRAWTVQSDEPGDDLILTRAGMDGVEETVRVRVELRVVR